MAAQVTGSGSQLVDANIPFRKLGMRSRFMRKWCGFWRGRGQQMEMSSKQLDIQLWSWLEKWRLGRCWHFGNSWSGRQNGYCKEKDHPGQNSEDHWILRTGKLAEKKLWKEAREAGGKLRIRWVQFHRCWEVRVSRKKLLITSVRAF